VRSRWRRRVRALVTAHPRSAGQAGAAGFLLKNTAPADIVRAIESVHAGDGSLSPSIARRLIALVASGSDADIRGRQATERLAVLTAREQEVAAAVGLGQSNAEIAGDLHMSLATAKAHVSSVLTKLGVDYRVQIALLVQEAAAG
jgi:DNA-binding NarL/FixJ family response regulator